MVNFMKTLFQDLVTNDILDPDCVVVDPMRNLPKFSGEKIESTDNHLDAFDD